MRDHTRHHRVQYFFDATSFWFAYKYQTSTKRKAFYYPHNNKLEVLWTAVPAISLTVLVSFGLYYWFKITGEAPQNAAIVEVTGHQFGWEFRYPGKDGQLGRKNYKMTNAVANNPLGQDWSDNRNLTISIQMNCTSW
jgi:cytochrome c oxidase subunit 2